MPPDDIEKGRGQPTQFPQNPPGKQIGPFHRTWPTTTAPCLAASGITDEQIIARGYRTITDADELESLNIPLNWRQVPGLWHTRVATRSAPSSVGSTVPTSRRPGLRNDISPKGQHDYLDVPAGCG